MGGLVLGLWSWQFRKANRLQKELETLQAQRTAQPAPMPEPEYKPYVPCTFPGCILEARGKHFNHTHI